MKKYIFICAASLMLLAYTAQAAVSIRYYNKDSKDWKFDVKIGGSSSTVTFDGSRTSSITIQGGSDKAEIKTECGWVTLSNNSKIEIKDGCITVK
ncbi:hypothetical protein N7E81_10090 [Reichenbachiella carrageenanivorans]|uniref:Uncharacterized protein n=1 Tax=Reichenbachiella carrageenanivorans TaxID=2979869 RepID=A0ABY6CY44_9BACT|nr:hypothetical protein [Reichenbachiella carrageenanivorans]UXX77718.1 hypothetical protein N7E81_10090 [Reichenbachiella carrageenanivorans]